MNIYLQEQREIVNSKPFRRLANKTQVVTETNDVIGSQNVQIRTRLTHSLEVANIGQEIALNIGHIGEYELNPTVLFNVGLLHDINHSALGHSGGEILDKVVSEVFNGELHFEGNAGNLVVIEKKLKKLTPLTVVSTIKYPFLIGGSDTDKGIYKNQYNRWMPILKETIDLQNQRPDIQRSRTYECDIMEFADDIAYLFSDFEDYLMLEEKDKLISTQDISVIFKEYGLTNANLFFTINQTVKDRNLSLLHDLKEQIIGDIYWNSRNNQIELKTKDYQILLRVLRKIDWIYYIQKFGTSCNNTVIKDYEEMLRFLFNNIEDKDIVCEFTFSQTQINEYLYKVANGYDRISLGKTILMSQVELTDTYAGKLIRLYKDKYKNEAPHPEG